MCLFLFSFDKKIQHFSFIWVSHKFLQWLSWTRQILNHYRTMDMNVFPVSLNGRPECWFLPLPGNKNSFEPLRVLWLGMLTCISNLHLFPGVWTFLPPRLYLREKPSLNNNTMLHSTNNPLLEAYSLTLYVKTGASWILKKTNYHQSSDNINHLSIGEWMLYIQREDKN